MSPNLQKPNTIVYFSNSYLLNIYNLLNQMHVLAKFQPHVLINLRVIAQQQKQLICLITDAY